MLVNQNCKTYAFVFARGGSKGVVGKNLRPLGGVPLIGHSILAAKKCDQIDKIFVSTDDFSIAEVAKEFGAEVIERPIELASDDSPEWLSWQHAVSYLEEVGDDFDVFLSLPATAPLRCQEDIENCLSGLTEDIDFVVTMSESSRSPWFNMVIKNGEMVTLLLPGKGFSRRQETPKTYDLTTVAYVSRPSCIKTAKSIFECRVKGVEVARIRALDIDTEDDLFVAELLFDQRKKHDAR